jgi:hypothetical protein
MLTTFPGLWEKIKHQKQFPDENRYNRTPSHPNKPSQKTPHKLKIKATHFKDFPVIPLEQKNQIFAAQELDTQPNV